MVSEPAEMPVTVPPETDARAGFELIHVPPITVSARVVVAATQTTPVPVMLPALGNGFTVTDSVAYAVPQEFVTA